MVPLTQCTWICLDCETTGLDPENDHIIEFAAVRFTLEAELDAFASLIDPGCAIPEASQAIHHISSDMVAGQPSINALLPEILAFIGTDTIVGHGVGFDIELLKQAAKRAKLPCQLSDRYIDTLRLARLYGDSPNNSLESLARHFNVPAEGAHRAMNDVRMNIAVFKHLTKRYKSVEQLRKTLASPINMKYMPLGKYKGRSFSDIPLHYLQWAAQLDFDEDLKYSIRLELKKRKGGQQFSQATNPFSGL